MANEVGVEAIQILGTTKSKTVTLKAIDIVLTIDEIDDLMAFLAHAKKSFVERQEDCSVKKLIKKDGVFGSEDITSYAKVVELGHETFDYHSHYCEWKGLGFDYQPDIVMHTTFKAEKKADDTFVWINEESN